MTPDCGCGYGRIATWRLPAEEYTAERRAELEAAGARLNRGVPAQGLAQTVSPLPEAVP
jgi:hypothetical protein